MAKLDYFKRQLADLTPNQRREVDDFLLGLVANDTEARAKTFELELASDYMEAAAKLRENWGRMQGLSSGYKSVDELTLGFVGGEVTVIAGPTSNGKTALATNITANIVRTGLPVLFVTMEMTKAQLTSRLLYAADDFEDYASLVVYQRQSELDWRSIHGLIRNASKEMYVGLVVIDHLHYFTRELERAAEDLGRITKEFSRAAKDFDVPIVLISHIRKLEKGKRASIEDLRGSSLIGQDADVALMVERFAEYPNEITVTCHKNRNRGHRPGDDVRVLGFDATKITEPQAMPNWLGNQA